MSQLSNEAQLIRAARNLMDAHGSEAAEVAERRAINLEQSGEKVSAKTWRQIAVAVRAMKAGGSGGGDVRFGGVAHGTTAIAGDASGEDR